MNPRLKKWLPGLAFLCVFAGGAVLSYLPPAQERHEAQTSTTPIDSDAGQRFTNGVSAGASSKANVSQSLNAQTGTPLRRFSTKVNRSAQAKNVPISFWGLVVDQDGKPLPGVRVRSKIRHWQLEGLYDIGTRFIVKEGVSGADGRFEFSGESGDVLSIEVLSKEGYEPEPIALRSFGYNISTNIVADPGNPVVLRMWKAEAKAELVTGDKHFGFVPDGRVYTLDLISGTKIESDSAPGDLRIRIKRPEGVTFGQRFDWSCAIEAVGGGLIEEPDLYASMYLAPTAGYEKVFAIKVQAADTRWSDGFRKRFYLSSRDGGAYARLSLDLSSLYSPENPNGSIWIKYALNPAGSRILR